MTVDEHNDSQDLLIDVDPMSFLDENEVSSGESNTSNKGFMGDDEIGRDPVSGALMVSLSKGHEPLPFGGTGKLKFKLSPLAFQNLCFLTEPHQYSLYPVRLPRIDTSEEYVNYVSRLFEVYRALGEDRLYSVPTIGLISSSESREHVAAVNVAMEAVTVELELYIESIRNKPSLFVRFLELEECLTILNCLKTVHFTLDTPGEEQRGKFIRNLMAWINRSDGEPDDELTEQVFAASSSDRKCFQNPPFWKLINRLLLRGLLDQARACIDRSELLSYLNGQCTTSANAIRDLMALLGQYPMESSSNFREWKTLALELAQTFSESETTISGDLRDSIEDTLLLVGGHHSRILSYSKTWYESLCGFLLYYIPSLELCEEYLQLSLKHNAVDVTNLWEQACVDILKSKVYSILPVLESLDTSAAAFSAAVCEAKGLIENYFDEENRDEGSNSSSDDLFSYKNGMACYMLNNFAFELCSYGDKNLWSIAIGLISLSPIGNPSAKRTAIAELLPHYPFKTNDDIEWMLSVCAKWRLPDVTKTIYIMLGNRLLYESNTIEAMANFSKAGKFSWVKRYSWMMFEASVLQGCPLDDVVLNAIVKDEDERVIPKEILDSLVTSSMKQTLAPYAVLYLFYEAQSNENWSEALDLLLALINFPFLPQYYMVLLVAKFLYPVFLKDSTKTMSEDSILSVLEAMEHKWDDNDEKSQNIYIALRDAGMQTLPETLKVLHKSVRKELNLKLCKEYM